MDFDRVIGVRTSKTIYRSGNTAVKVFSEGAAKSDVLGVAFNPSLMEETEVRVPKVLGVSQIDGKWAILSEYVAGKSIEQLMTDEPGRRAEWMGLFVDLQILINRQHSPLLPRMRDRMNLNIARTSLDATVRYDLHERLETMPRHDKVCHGDFRPRDVLITPDGTPCVLGWANVTRGNAAADAAHAFLHFMLSGDRETAKEYLALYCEKTGEEDRYIRRWLPLAAASQSVGSEPAEKETLLRWASDQPIE